MVVYGSLNNLPKFQSSVVTIGSFDGLHLGHLELLNLTKRISTEKKNKSVVVTFSTHPRLVLDESLESSQYLLADESKKYDLLEKSCIDILLNIPFTAELSKIEPEYFLKEIIIKYFSPSDIVIGYDHHFGKNGKGDKHLLKKNEEAFDYNLHIVEEFCINNQLVSSTNIRNCIYEGNIAEANSFLGWNYELNGTVVHGEKRGSKIGFPTANINLVNKNQIIPANGAYIVQVILENKTYNGMCNIGKRPTFEERENSVIEVHIFNVENINIYEKNITIIFNCQLRKEIKFQDENNLKKQLLKDKANCLEYVRCQRR